MQPSRFTGGRITKEGQTEEGTDDFVSNKVNTGTYQIIFEPPFKTLMAIVAIQISNFPEGNPLDNAVIISTDVDQCTIRVGDPEGKWVDRACSFIAMGV